MLRTATSPVGNYIYIVNPADINRDSALLANTAYFNIERMEYDTANINKTERPLKKIGEARVVASAGELKNYFTASDINDMKKQFSLSSDQALVKYLGAHHTVEDLSIFYKNIETRRALGQVFLDKDVTDNEMVIYKITRVDKMNLSYPWGFSIVQSRVGNYILPYLKPMISKIASYDSAVTITWKLRIQDDSIAQVPIPRSKFAFDSTSTVYKMPFQLKNLLGRLFLFTDGKWVASNKLMPQLNAAGDTLTFIFYKKCKREEVVAAYLVTEDEVYNQGRSSDTAFAYALEKKSVPLIYGIHVADTLNAIRLSWKQLPAKAYYTGIQITRYNSQDNLDSIAVLSPRDTAYTDYAIKVGQHYRYQVKAMFLAGLGLSQDIPAEGVGTYSKFSHPLPPYNLTASSDSGHVSLKWDGIDEPGFFGYFVYRGTSSRKMDLIAGPVKTKEYTDTSSSLSGRSQYYYKVVNQNLRQDTSDYSNIVNIMPVKKITIVPPGDITFYYANGKLNVQWKDLKKADNSIASYIVQKKKKEDSTFTTITAASVKQPLIVDSNLLAGATYQYRVAALSFKGDSSVYGDAAAFTLPKKEVGSIKVFFVRNVTAGVEISLPQETYDNRKAYNIYRRKAAEASFTRINTIDASQFSYIDATAQPNSVYVYAVTITEKDDREGSLGRSISVRRAGGGGR